MSSICDTLFVLIPLLVVGSKAEAAEVKAVLHAVAEYKTACLTIMAARAVANDAAASADAAGRQVELAAYTTHCALEPPHLMLALNMAMATAFKHKNFIHAAGFARRLLEMPDINSAKNAQMLTRVSAPRDKRGRARRARVRMPLRRLSSTRACPPLSPCLAPPLPTPQAKAVLQKSEAEARNALKVDYDDHTPFVLCAGSLTPIYRGAPLVRSPFSGAAYQPSFKGSVCVIDSMAQVGLETLGLVSAHAKASAGGKH